jgi:hypothetical protein
MSVKKSREMAKPAGAVVMVVVMREMSGLIGYTPMNLAYGLGSLSSIPILFGLAQYANPNWPGQRLAAIKYRRKRFSI